MEHTNYRSKTFLLFYLFVAVLLQRNMCWGAPILSIRNTSDVDRDNSTAYATSEQQGDEFADLQELRSGLKVLNTVTKNQLAAALQLSGENKTALDHANNATGIRLALTVTCGLKRSAEALWHVPIPSNGTAPNANLTLLRTASDSLYRSSCLWVGSLYRVNYPNSTMNFSCNSFEEMTSICNSLDLLNFTETLRKQYYTLQSLILNQTNSDRWLKENIKQNSVLPEVYSLIHQQ